MKRLLMLGVLLLLSEPATAQHDQLERVVRRGDRRGVILLFKTQLDQPTQPKDARAFVLVDLTAEQTIGLKDQSVTTPDRCPQPEEFESSLDRVCVELEDASPALVDTHQYALLTAPIQLKGVLIPALTVAIPPVSGAVQPIQNGTDDVEIVFSRDLSGEAVVPRITWDGTSQTVMNPQAPPRGPPQCYRRGSLSFLCTLRHRVPNGAVVSADLVTLEGQPAGFGDIAPTTAQVKAPEKKEDVQVFYLNVGLARGDEVTNGSSAREECPEFVTEHIDPWHLGARLGYIVHKNEDGSDKSPWWIDLDLDYFVTHDNYPLAASDFVRRIGKLIARGLQNNAIRLVTIALSPETSSGWDHAEALLAELTADWPPETRLTLPRPSASPED